MKVNYNTNPKILNNFLYYLQNIRNFTEDTIKAYNSDLLHFFYFIKEYNKIPIEIKDFNVFILANVKEADIIAFLVYLNFNRDNKPSSRNRRLSAIRSFYKWLLYTNPTIQKENPAKEILNSGKIFRLPKYLNLQQAQKIQNIFTLENSKFPIRNNAIISLFLNTGTRASELINIDIKDINFKNNSIIVSGKGNKERVVFFANSCKEKLIKYLNIRFKGKTFIDISEPLFISCRKKRISIDAIEDICSKAYQLMGLKEYKYTTHTLRHTAATLIYIYVAQDILLLKKILGHESITSTEIYTQVYDSKTKEAFEKNPLSNITKEKAA